MKKWQFIHVFIGLFVIICCNNDDKQINNFEQEQNNKEYLTALKLIQGFSKEQNQDLSRNAANKLIITNIEKGSINCTDKQIISRSKENINSNVNIYTFTIKTNGQTGFAIATGDKRIAQVLVYVKNGAISDTTEIPAMAFMIRGIKTSLKRDLKEYYDGSDNLSRNDQNWTTVSTTEFVKTKWSTKSPYNNNYDLGNCSTTTNKKYRASTAAVAFAQAITANKKRPVNFPFEYCISEWKREPKIDEKYNLYVPQLTEFIKSLEPSSVKLQCSESSWSDIQALLTMSNYYGYIRDQSYTYDISANYAKIAKNAQAGYCTLFGGHKSVPFVSGSYYVWIVDGFKGKVNPDKTQAKMAQIHCVYCYEGKGDGWYSNPFGAVSGEQPGIADQFQFMYFNEI
ncbi:hypothetical protein [Butyricimonas virosa]|uniref:hypothetical protein n=1 Tax=Butyricimonas virosa TaxID=544645 RepID=UPI0022DF7292|nr:hypothetical protein [Butyricimonas virosa]